MAFPIKWKWWSRIAALFLVVGVAVALRLAWTQDAKPVLRIYRWMHDTTRIDFGLPLASIDGSNRSFSEFEHRRLLLFYFSPTCGHCQKGFAKIRSFRDSYQGDSMAFVAVATGKASSEDVDAFKTDFQLDMPAFQDKARRFSKLYNTGRVPLMLLVSRDGTFEAWNSADSTTLDSVEIAIKKSLGRP